MEFLTPYAVGAAIAFLILGFLIKAMVKVFFKDDPQHKHIQTVLFPVVLALIGFYATKIVEISMMVTENHKAMKRIEERQAESENFLRAVESLGKYSNGSTLRKLLTEEFGFVSEKLRQISQGELILKREEVIPKWEKLILNSNHQVRATNIVSLDDWKKFSPTEGEEVHKKAMAGGVKIQRIFIYSGDDKAGYDRLKEKAVSQKKWGVDVRMLNGDWITESPFVSDLLRDVGTPDVVIFDDECVLLTSVDGNGNIVASTITNNVHRLQKAKEFYDKLWEEAKEVN